MEALHSGFSLLMSLDVLLALSIGSIGGVIIGAIPGVGPAVAIAILLPATFALPPLTGLIMLLGIYGSSMFGGALPAILINTPGTAVNALTTYDGFPMTKRGEAARALGLAYGASFFSGILSVVALMLFAPLLAKIAPMFGAREIFLAALLGIILVIVAHRGHVAAAGMMAGLGILLQSVGMEPVKYTMRFTFGQGWLTSGVELIVVVLGLFAISQALTLLIAPENAPRTAPVTGNVGREMMGVWKYRRVATAGSVFGVVMGIIPGVGEFTAQFMSYTFARKRSATPETFGKGSAEGLVASESANNAVPAAAMIPLLALGIPGEALTAMMLSVFYVHNVVPGPALFRDDLGFVYALFIALIALNILVVGFMLAASNWIVRLTRIPTRFLGMMILTLSFVGVYSLRNSIVDCALAAGFGVLGLILKRLHLPIVPIILGMVLGGIMEVKLRAALARVESPLDFLNRPISALLVLSILWVVAAHARPGLMDGMVNAIWTGLKRRSK
ncbi:tripartite tricarboxylate transporter permease [Tropicimonas marinistellae]|uniref:tripartite tricarboxylate transporter permease n=1 Tax=Tropicimonas marinistellae TaxID=1739787 RepID=UPI000990028C|nr:tripartite tricarboxylate transporter permease [Tropicimonas marinistellae]